MNRLVCLPWTRNTRRKEFSRARGGARALLPLHCNARSDRAGATHPEIVTWLYRPRPAAVREAVGADYTESPEPSNAGTSSVTGRCYSASGRDSSNRYMVTSEQPMQAQPLLPFRCISIHDPRFSTTPSPPGARLGYSSVTFSQWIWMAFQAVAQKPSNSY